jgi:DnaD/phage-associated family protein
MTPAEDGHSTSLDLALLDLILARAHDASEIKVVLQVVRLSAANGSPRVALERLLAPDSARAIVGVDSPEPAEARVRRAIERAVADGLLHRVTVRTSGHEDTFLLPATAENGRLVRRLRDGRGEAGLELPPGNEVVVHRPNVFSLYEQHIGPLTPLVAEHLREAERAYPREWLEQAILQSVEYNARSWRYIEAILQRWEAEGGPTFALR